jgi:hypothetical protein
LDRVELASDTQHESADLGNRPPSVPVLQELVRCFTNLSWRELSVSFVLGDLYSISDLRSRDEIDSELLLTTNSMNLARRDPWFVGVEIPAKILERVLLQFIKRRSLTGADSWLHVDADC